MTTATYWPLTPADQLPGEMLRRIRAYRRYFEGSGRLALARRALACYWGLDPAGGWSKSSAVTFKGTQGEIAQFVMNHFRSLVDARTNMVTAQRLAYEARAANADWESIEAARIAEALIESDLATTNLEWCYRERVRLAQVVGEGWLWQIWDPTRGKAIAGEKVPVTGPDGAPVLNAEGQPATRASFLHEGEVVQRVLSPIDVIRDFRRRDCDHDWLIARLSVNRYDLIAQYPELESEILGATRDKEASLEMWDRPAYSSRDAAELPEDQVDMFALVHRKTRSVEDGRIAFLVGSRLLQPPAPLPCDELPLYMLAEAIEDGTCFGSSPMVDLIAPQQALSSCDTAILTNHDDSALPPIWTKPGSDLTVEKLTGGRSHISATMKPEVLELSGPTEASYKARETWKRDMETLARINSTVRGNPQENVKSGAFAALVVTNAVQANGDLQKAASRDFDSTTSARVRLYQLNAKEPRLIETVGADDRYAVEEFVGDQLSAVRRIVSSVGNPMLATTEGRKELLKLYVELGAVTDPMQIQEFLDTGRFEPLVHYPTAEPRFIRWENQELITKDLGPCEACGGSGQVAAPAPQIGLSVNGVDVPPEATDCEACGGQGQSLGDVQAIAVETHKLHIPEHTAMLHQPGVRKDKAATARLLGHIRQHQMLEEKLAAKEQQARADAQMQLGPGGPAGPDGQKPNGGPPSVSSDKPAERANVPGAPPDVGGVKPPLMPENPMTGQRMSASGPQPAAPTAGGSR